MNLVRSPHFRPGTKRRPIPVWGVALHTTGGGLPEKAAAKGTPALEYAADLYGSMSSYAHYVIDGAGGVLQCCDELDVAPHIGRIVDGVDRRPQYLGGEWAKLLPAALVERWRAAWPGFKNPYQLFPGPSPNEAYVGVELIPIHPAPKGIRFTRPQLAAAAQLLTDIGQRRSLPPGWWMGRRLLGHEDVGLLDRSDARGGWDPGSLRADPYFDFPAFRALVGAVATAPARVA